MKKILFMVGLLIPFSVHANYDPEQLKQGIDAEKLFEAKAWIQAGDSMWRLDSAVSEMKLVVLKENAALSMPIVSPQQLDDTMKRCEKFASLGLAASGDKLSEINGLIRSVTKNGNPKMMELNNVKLEVEFTTIKRRNKDIFSCSVSKKG